MLKRLIECLWSDLPAWAGERLGKASREELESWTERVLEAQGWKGQRRVADRQRPVGADRGGVGAAPSRLCGSPLALSQVDEIVDHIARVRPMAAERIIYRVDDGSVLILTVRHGRRLLDLEEIEGGSG